MDNPEKTEGAMKNGQSREAGNIVYTRYKTKTNKHRTQKTNKMNDMDPTKNTHEGIQYSLFQTKQYPT